ncbi:MAG TPA: oxalate/formate MFS antiporter, partial [Vicinamibacterales bacterium]|nr:oxalate/formate MFS antiporter [Vicinamibacterales bacterium]
MNSASPNARWIQLLLGLVCMIVISSPQYVWALFTQPLTTGLGASLPELQITFSILIVVQTFLSPWQGVLVDRFGPRLLLSIGVLVTGLSWILAAQASSLTMLYLTYGLLGGIGTGIVYVGVIGHMVQWFPDRRGLATGLVAAGYGVGALLTTFPIATVLRESTYEDALTRFGLIFGIVGLVAAQGLQRPDAAWQMARNQRARTAGSASTTSIDLSPIQMLGTRIFWLMFVMMTMMSTTGLMVTSQMGAFTRDFGMASVLVWGLPLLPLALSLDRITNGATRPFFGWVSDRYGRENTMLIAFALEGTAMTLWLLSREHAVLFVLLSGLVFFGWGEIFSLFPSTLTDTFGTKHATANYGCLYMAQGVGSVLGGPVAALLHDSTGSWFPVFAVIIAMDFTTAALAIAVLKPMRQRWLAAARMASTVASDRQVV